MSESFTAASNDAGKRFDHFLQEKMTGYSRARLQTWIKEGRALIDGGAALTVVRIEPAFAVAGTGSLQRLSRHTNPSPSLSSSPQRA